MEKNTSIGIRTSLQNRFCSQKNFKQFLNLPYFKVTRIREAYDYISHYIQNFSEKNVFPHFIDYFEDTFVGKNPSSYPSFEHKRWSVFERVEKYLPTMTNSIEN
ncbi:hypothetical protein DMUE_4098 [Dictyocoela muelleri]|nr:hypothetical protein DMUE_4098 [Dictyocoela muelleri]